MERFTPVIKQPGEKYGTTDGADFRGWGKYKNLT
jgi:hypothetical protein